MTDAERLKTRVLAAAAATPSPTRREGRRRGLALLLASTMLALLVLEGAGGVGHSAGRPLELTLAIAGGWGLFSAGLSWVVLWRGRSMLGPRSAVLILATLATPIALVAWLYAFHGAYTEPFARVGWRCLGYTLAMAALPLGGLFSLRRGVEPRHPWALGGAMGAVCGAWAGALVDVWCPLTNLPHALVGHALPIGLLVAVGAFAGRSQLGVRNLPLGAAAKGD